MSTPGFNEFHDHLWNCEITLASNDAILHYALVHMKELLNNMQTKRFDESLRIVGDHNKFLLRKTTEKKISNGLA